MNVADKYEAFLDSNGESENDLQNFLEHHPELLPFSSWELGHGVRLDAAITKFPIDSTLITDFAFLTKNTGTWRIVLIEIEPATVPLFTGAVDAPQPTAEFTKRLTQIELWKQFIKRNPDTVVDHLKPLMKAFPHNPIEYEIEFKYVLIVGRRSGLENEKALKQFRAKCTEDTEVITHDSLVSRLTQKQNFRGNILRMEGSHFTYKYLTCPSWHAFDSVTANDVVLGERHMRRLVRHGFEIDKWKGGARLNALGKAPIVSGGLNGVSVGEVLDLHRRLRADTEDV